MHWISLPLVRAALVALLMLGTLVRPMLVLTCEIHAIRFAHASQPHVHQHGGAVEDTGDTGHGEHEVQHQGALGSAADTVSPLLVPALAYRVTLSPMPLHLPLLERHTGAPFRPPIV